MDEGSAKSRRGRLDPTLQVLALGGAVALGLALQRVLGARLEEIEALAAHDVVAARLELAFLLRVASSLVFGMTAAVGAGMLASSRKALAAGVFPPPGVWSWGARRTVGGPRARTLARVSIALGTLLISCSVAGLALVFYMAERLLACKAG